MFCPDCDYFTDRRDNLARHIGLEHSHKKMVRSLLDDILIGVTAAADTPGEDVNGGDNEGGAAAHVEDEVESGHVESAYLKMRNARVAEIQKEFHLLFPSFEEEVQGLRVKPKKKNKNKKKPILMTSCRKSSRVPRRHPDPVNSLAEEVTGAGVMVGDCSAGDEGRVAGEQVLDAGNDGQGADDQVLTGGDNGHGRGKDGLVPVGGEMVGDVPNPVGGGTGDVQEDHNLGKHGCLPCGLTFRDSSNLRRHVQLVHTRRSEPIPCPRSWCEAKFDILAEMRQHKVNCMRVCPYEGCMKSFIRPEKFAAHLRSHSAMARRMTD